ncbi:CoA pyrophosphatase [Aquabacterium sp.]|uniref:CoA pyrophosphatase n=1 Tax=Aquabacterium sp. TaxID=1872578 RepID=UPI002CBEE4B4|nr:CoA pyrophosphatase [Aquabacterium sp.]HSW08037.1 CoA pyrophosphatase [Aquabacterium sp.]
MSTPTVPPRITNPLSIPVIGIDDHLPAVQHNALTPAALRRRFEAPPSWTPETQGDGKAFFERELSHASVLVPLVMRDTGLQVLLTRRTDHLRDHAGQISFPGGRAEDHDADAVATALRETEEEVGLAREHVDVIGALPHYTTVTSYVVTPVVALVRPGFSLALDSFEVAEAFEVPLQFLMTPAHHRRHLFEYDGQSRQFLSMPWTGLGADGQQRDYFIWGATAAMLRNFYRFLAA